jgi:Spy/CpxP family protein refolding chaperone
MREHIKAFLLTSSLAFGILGLTEAQRDRIFQILHDQAPATGCASDMALMRAETLSRVAAVLTPAQRDKLALFHLH